MPCTLRSRCDPKARWDELHLFYEQLTIDAE
jgi:hypothetical protein